MTREEIERDVAAFLAKGGRITYVPMGIGAINFGKTFESMAVNNRKPKNRGLAISLAKRRKK